MTGKYTLAREGTNMDDRTATYSVVPPQPIASDMPRFVMFTFSNQLEFETPPLRLRMEITEIE